MKKLIAICVVAIFVGFISIGDSYADMVVDDFEAYNDSSNLIWDTWIDGDGSDENGAEVDISTSIRYSGAQSMLFDYDNTGEITYAEAARAIIPPQDWSAAETLRLFFRGTSGNTGHLYVQVNDSKITYDGSPPVSWTSWNITLAAFGNLQNVTDLALGIDGEGAIGTLYFDNISVIGDVSVVPATIHVPADFATIQAAIDAAANGDEIEVAPGTYNEAINFNGKAVRLYSSGGAADTTINGGGGLGTVVVRCSSSEGPGTILEGFTITGGNGGAYGGGMFNFVNCSPTVTNCIFTGNSAGTCGAGMNNSYNSNPNVTGCTFSNNSAQWGGGMFNFTNSSPTVTDCTFTGNLASMDGGGMYNWDYSSPTVTNCNFSGNSAGTHGGGMNNNNDCNPTVTDCTFSGNSAGSDGAGLNNWRSNPTVIVCTFQDNFANSHGGGMRNRQSSPNVTNCTFSSNAAELGGGMSNKDNCSPTVISCTFTGNSAGWGGGGMRNQYSSSPTVTGCTFTNNSSDLYGGGMSNQYNNSNPTVTNCTFSGNAAQLGGGMSNKDNSSPTVTDCSFTDNSAIGEFGSGGGMRNDNYCSPTVIGCNFSGNSASYGGGGMRNQYNSSPTVTDCMFTDNSAIGSRGGGGGMDNDYYCHPDVSNCTFSGNTAVWAGGGMRCRYDSSPRVTNCIFVSNFTDRGGGGMQNAHNSNPTLSNCKFSYNSAGTTGGGMSNWQSSNPEVTNCTFSDNSAVSSGGGVNNGDSNPTLTNCILWADTAPTGVEIYNDGSSSANVSYSDVQGGWTGIGNIDADPFFADSDGRLSLWSPCINAGDNSAVPPGATDLDGNPRIFNGIVVVVDMGAYECMSNPENTPPGDDVEVSVSDSETETTITMSFDTVDSGGNTTVAITDEGPDTPTGFKLVPLETYYDIETTAVFSGMIQIAIEYDDTGLNPGQERALKLRVYEENKWVNITTGLDTENNIIYGESNHLSLFAITSGILVEIDIKPGSYPNAINLGSQGVIPVAILSSSDFDATTVNPATVELSGSYVALRGKADKYMAHKEDIDGDGLIDLLVQVETENLDPETFQYGFMDLIGQTYDEVPIKGEDEIIIVPPEN